MFGFHMAEGFGIARLSIWVGPLSAIPPAAPAFGKSGHSV
jgi:hypothetical protein